MNSRHVKMAFAAALALSVIAVSGASCDATNGRSRSEAVARMVEAGADPISARCALTYCDPATLLVIGKRAAP